MAKTSTTSRTRSPISHREADLRKLELALVQLLLITRQSPLKLLKSGAPSKTFLNKLEPALQEFATVLKTNVELFSLLLLSIARSASLLREQDGVLIPDFLKADKIFAMASNERLSILRQAWLDSSDFNEFPHIPTLEVVEPKVGETLTTNDVVPGVGRMKEIRKRILKHLEEAPEGRWIRFSKFCKDIQEQDPHFLVRKASAGRFAPPKYYGGVRKLGEKSDIEREGNWPEVEGALVELFVRLPFHLLGYADIGEYGAEDGDLALRYRREGVSPVQPPKDAQLLTIQANFEIIVFLPEISIPSLWKTARLCSPTDFLEVARFQIEERHVASWINDGYSLDQLCDFLESNSKSGLPQNVRYTLSEWAQRAQRITIYLDAYLFEAEGVEDLNKLIHEPYQKRAELKVLLDRHRIGAALACPNPAEGIAPRYPVLDYSRPLPSPVLAQGDGLFTCLPEEIHFRAIQILSRVAEQESLERWRMTRESFRRAIEGGLPLERVMSLLESVVKGELPPLLHLRMLAWAGRAGGVELEKVTLLKFRQRETGELLQRDTEASKLLAEPLNETTFRLLDSEVADIRTLIQDLSLEVEDRTEE